MRSTRVHIGLSLVLVGAVLVGLLAAPSATAQNERGPRPVPLQREWTEQFGSAGHDFAVDIAIGLGGELYVVGQTDGALPGHVDERSESEGFVVAFTAGGEVSWSDQFALGLTTVSIGVAVGPDGAVHVAGVTARREGGRRDSDAFLRTYDAGGSVRRTDVFGTDQADKAWDVTVDAAGTRYVTGETRGAFPGFENRGRAQQGFVVAVGADGTTPWVDQFGATGGYVEPQGLVVGANGKLYATGATTGSLPGSANPGRQHQGFLRAISLEGNPLWTEQFSLSEVASTGPKDIAAGPGGAIYVVGGLLGPASGPEQGRDAFVRAFAPSGRVLWDDRFGDTQHDLIEGAAVDAGGRLFVAGPFVLRAYTRSGGVLWDDRLEPNTYANAVAVGRRSNLFVTGEVRGTLPGTQSQGGVDGFLTRFNGPPQCRGRWATLVGTAGPDVLVGTPRPDVVVARAGDDVVSGQAGDDVVCAGPGDDTVRSGVGDDAVVAGPGDDLVRGGFGDDELRGLGGVDRLEGGPGIDRLFGSAGDDRLLGSAGEDILRGGRGRDVLIAGDDDDTVLGGDDNDILHGRAGDDHLDGGNGFDRCRGGPGQNVLRRCERGA